MNEQEAATGQPLRIFVFDSTRLRSHLFFRYLSTHPDLASIYHPFLSAAMFGPEYKSQYLRNSPMREKEIQELWQPLNGTDTFASSELGFRNVVSEAESRGKIVLANEHWFNVLKLNVVLDLIRGVTNEPGGLSRNPTHLPDDMFDSLTPIILIRHPALSINSIYRDALKMTQMRQGDEDFSLITSNKSLRLLFDYFTAQGRRPIVVDAEDILWRTEDMSRNLCLQLGIDPEGLSERWTATPKHEIEQMKPALYKLTKTIHDSSGIERPAEKPDDPDLNKSFRDWTEKYGSDTAQQLKERAEENMVHYEYLKQFKV